MIPFVIKYPVTVAILMIVALTFHWYYQPQPTEESKLVCPLGKIEGGGMSTSSFTYSRGCYTPEEKAHLDERFAESLCQEAGSISYNQLYDGSIVLSGTIHEWINGQCLITPLCQKSTKLNTWQKLHPKECELYEPTTPGK